MNDTPLTKQPASETVARIKSIIEKTDTGRKPAHLTADDLEFLLETLLIFITSTPFKTAVKKPVKIQCPDCEAFVVNNIPTHETGCPNEKLEWVSKWDREDCSFDLDAPDHWSSPDGCHVDCPACEELETLVPDDRDL